MGTSVEIQISDMHVGHKTAIMYPDGNLDYKPNKGQKWVFWVWQSQFLPAVEKLLDKYKPDHVHLSLLGDMGDIDWKKRTSFVWTRDTEIIRDNAVTLLKPLVNMADSVHSVRGTLAHIGEGGGIDEYIASDLDNSVPAEGYKQFSHWYALFELEGVLFEIAHHGKNRSKWTDLTGLISLGNEIILKRTKNGQRIPDVVSRGHFHWSGHIPDTKPYTVAVASWQLPTDYVYRIDPTVETPHVGGHVVVVRDGEIIKGERFKYMYERSKVWKPKKGIRKWLKK